MSSHSATNATCASASFRYTAKVNINNLVHATVATNDCAPLHFGNIYIDYRVSSFFLVFFTVVLMSDYQYIYCVEWADFSGIYVHISLQRVTEA